MTTTEASRDVVFDEIAGMLRKVLAELGVDDVEITELTSFNEDLELESIDLVTLTALATEHWGEPVNLAEFLADKDLDEVIALKVGDLVDFVVAALARAGG
ncbi:phosphopantetheine-binding protein [Kutzneria sp. CA-103260]|uniref:phosphopantetheine-binding protein n=1 Tax=Kutzneria sp. CA-103260 TaxID=2802641 RepID=UPI001BA734B2|nr:phosphopantetheine-binding protein [Kutzneria sp. CA-103260]QUQ70371.1 acyl carrier protein [Kutzneria sp. CA-103260]